MEEGFGKKIWGVFERFVLFCMNLILRPFGKGLEGQKADAFMQFVKFALVGVSNTLVSYGINALTLFILGKYDLFPATDIYIANTVAFFLSVLWAYYWSNRYVFKEDENGEKRIWWKTLIKTYLSYAFTGLGLSNLISGVGVNVFGLNKYIPPIINLFISVPINFVLNKFWAYGQKKKEGTEEAASSAEAETTGEVSL